ncbi:MAG: PAS domain S-box protein [Planctomycetes bacterium]|nr:PAS domain S-box protein [Planctomycetota bacterium]
MEKKNSRRGRLRTPRRSRGKPQGGSGAGRKAGIPQADPGGKFHNPAESHECLNIIINTISDPIFVKDEQYRNIFVNDAMCRLIGKTRQEIIGKTSSHFFPSEQADIFHRVDEQVLRTGVVSNAMEPITDASGQVRSVIVLKNRCVDEAGRRYVVGILKDITDLHRIEEALRESNERQKVILKTGPDGIWQADMQGRLLEVNDSYCRMSGYSREELLTMKIADLEASETASDVDAHLQKIASRGWDRFQSRHRRKDGSVFDVEISVQYRDVEGGRIVTFLRDITDRNRAEEELHESRQQLQLVLDNIPQRVFCKGLDLKYLWANRSFLADAGLSEVSDLIGKLDQQLSWKACADAYQADDRYVMETDTAKIQYEEPQTKSDGSMLWLRTSKIPLHDKDGRIIGVLGTYEDITELTLARRRLLESERKYRELFESMPDGSAVFDLSGRIVEFNAAFQAMIGHETGDIFNLTSHDITPGKWRDMEDRIIRDQVMVRGFSDVYEKEYVREDGAVVPVEVRIYLICEEDGAPHRLWAFVRNITDRRRIEDEIRQRSRIMENMSEGVQLTRSRDGIIVYVNSALEKIFGYAPEELVGRHVSILNAPGEKTPEETARDIMNALAETGRWSGDIQNMKKDGSLFWCHANVSAFDHPQHGEIWISVHEDITDRKKAEEERKKLEEGLQQTQKLESLGILAGGVAHDFNNLLTGILGHSTLAMEKMPRGSLAWEHMEDIEKSARRAADLTRQLLAYSGKGKFVVEPLCLSDVVDDMAHLLEISISKKCVLKYHFAKDLPPVEADVTQIRQVVMNLIMNASEAIGERSGVISVTTGAMDCDEAYLAENYLRQDMTAGLYVYLEVSDTGSGMTGEVKARIFDPFFTTKFAGRGLGLAAVLGIVRGHRGAIKVYSEPGRGSTFKMLLPAGKSAPPNQAADNNLPAQKLGHGLILVVDDEETVRTLGRKVLETGGYTVLTASDGGEALKIFRDNAGEIRAVLLDMTMPHMDGEETFRELRRIRPDVKVLLSSGYNEQDAINHFAGKGLAGFIQKPYAMKDLLDAIAKVTG